MYTFMYVFSGAVAVPDLYLSSSAYSGFPVLRYVACSGTEFSISECDYEILEYGYCNYNYAGVSCAGDIHVV